MFVIFPVSTGTEYYKLHRDMSYYGLLHSISLQFLKCTDVPNKYATYTITMILKYELVQSNAI